MTMKVFLAINRTKPDAAEAAKLLRECLKTAGIEETASKESCDVIITLGGDGTILSYAGTGKPLLGINLGRLGYMTALEQNEIELAGRLGDGFTFEAVDRMMLDIRVMRRKKCVYSATALNEAVITRSGMPQLCDMELSFNGMTVTRYAADGMIIATPTGSTAYSMSAGGPVVDPRLDAIIVTPVCSHNPAKSRSIVTNASTLVRIIPIALHAKQLCIAPDGRGGILLEPDDTVEISKSARTTTLIKKKDRSFGGLLYINDTDRPE